MPCASATKKRQILKILVMKTSKFSLETEEGTRHLRRWFQSRVSGGFQHTKMFNNFMDESIHISKECL